MLTVNSFIRYSVCFSKPRSKPDPIPDWNIPFFHTRIRSWLIKVVLSIILLIVNKFLLSSIWKRKFLFIWRWRVHTWFQIKTAQNPNLWHIPRHITISGVYHPSSCAKHMFGRPGLSSYFSKILKVRCFQILLDDDISYLFTQLRLSSVKLVALVTFLVMVPM